MKKMIKVNFIFEILTKKLFKRELLSKKFANYEINCIFAQLIFI